MRREEEEAARRRRSAELLAGADLFAGLDRVTLAKLAANLDCVSFRKGEAACIEGEPGDSLYIVSEGTFGVFVGGGGDDRKLWVATLRPGGCFGEMALLTASRARQASSPTAKASCFASIRSVSRISCAAIRASAWR